MGVSESNPFKQQLSQYRVIARAPENNLTHLCHMKTSKQYALHELIFHDENLYKKSYDEHKLRLNVQSDHLTNLSRVEGKQIDHLCSNLYKLYSIWEYPYRFLSEEISERALQARRFEKKELWSILASCIHGMSTLQKHRIKHECLSTNSILLDNQGIVKVVDPLAAGRTTNFETVYNNRNIQNFYLSPEQCATLQAGSRYSNCYKNDIWSMGMILLECGLLESQSKCYRNSYQKVDQNQLNDSLIRFSRLYREEELTSILELMLKRDEKERPDWVCLKQLTNRSLGDEPAKQLSSHNSPFLSPQQYGSAGHPPIELRNYSNYQPQYTFSQYTYNPTQTSSFNQYNSRKHDGKSLEATKRPFSEYPPFSHHQAVQGVPDPLVPPAKVLASFNLYEAAKGLGPVGMGDPRGFDHSSLTQNGQQMWEQFEQSSPDIGEEQRTTLRNESAQRQHHPIQSQHNRIFTFKHIMENHEQEGSKQQNHEVPEPIWNSQQSEHKEASRAQASSVQLKKDTNNHGQLSQGPLNRGQPSRDRLSRGQPSRDRLSDNENIPAQGQNSRERTSESLGIQSQRSSQHQSRRSETNVNNSDLEYVVENFKQGSRYEGFKLNDMRHGTGIFFYQDGGRYDGEWKMNKMDGYGALYYQSGKLAYEGQWRNDQFQGQGKLYNENPCQLQGFFDYTNFDEIEDFWERYEGNFCEDFKKGNGKLYLSNSEYFQGTFDNDMVEGPGDFHTKNGQIIRGIWTDNHLQ